MVGAEGGGDFAAVEIGAVRGGDAEMAGDGLERMVLERAVGDVVGEGEQIGVDHLAAVEVVAGVGDGAFGGGEARGGGRRPAAVAAEGQRHAQPPRARFKVGQVELEEVVADHDVRVALPDRLDEFPQQGFFVEVAPVEDDFPALAVGEGDGEDAVLRAVGIGEVAVGGAVGLEVEEQEFQVGQEEVAEGGAAGVEQELLDGVAKDEVGRAGIGRGAAGGFAEVAEGLFQRGPGREARQDAEGVVAGEAHDLRRGFEAGEGLGPGEPQEGGERFLARGEFSVAAQEKRHGVRRFAGRVLDGDEARFRREPIDQFVAGERLHDGESIEDAAARGKPENGCHP